MRVEWGKTRAHQLYTRQREEITSGRSSESFAQGYAAPATAVANERCLPDVFVLAKTVLPAG